MTESLLALTSDAEEAKSVRTEVALGITKALEDAASKERMRRLNAVEKDAVFIS